MADSKSRLGSFNAVMAGFILLLAGMAGLGLSLTDAAHASTTLAIGAGIVTVVCLSSGMVVLLFAYRRRGGLMREKPSPSDVETYREDYRQ